MKAMLVSDSGRYQAVDSTLLKLLGLLVYLIPF